MCKDAEFSIEDITTRPVKKSPAAPFTTSTLQQEAARKLGFTVAQTMMVAQRLYESGQITYMRTDSVNLSDLALAACKSTVISLMGERYVKTRQFATKTKVLRKLTKRFVRRICRTRLLRERHRSRDCTN